MLSYIQNAAIYEIDWRQSEGKRVKDTILLLRASTFCRDSPVSPFRGVSKI
jgi:hypothetical protein